MTTDDHTALLKNATTEELLQEIVSRGDSEEYYTDLGRAMAMGARNLIDDLPGSMLDYKATGEKS